MYSEALALKPDNEAILSNRAGAYTCLEEYKKALEDAEAAIRINKDYPKGYYRKAFVLRELDKVSEALEVLKAAPEIVFEDKVMIKLLSEVQAEFNADNVLPKDHPEIIGFNKLVKWLSDGGATFDKIKMRYYSEGYRGVHAKAKIKKKENFLYIPRNLLITLEMSKEAPVGAQMAKLKVPLLSPKHSYLSSYVLQELYNKDTKWKPYLDMLPKDLSSFPIFFTHEEKKWLDGSPFLDQVEDKIKDMEKDYNAIAIVVPEFSKYTLEEFKRVRMLVSSRIFGVKIDGNKTDALVPLADMLNHKRPQETSWEYNEDKKGFIIEAKTGIERGDQVYDSYGKKCNSRYFLNYGFTVENNDGNEVPIKISLNEDDELQHAKKKILGNGISKTIRVSEDLTEKNMVHFFSFLRFVNFKGEAMRLFEFEIMENSSKKSDEDGEESFQCTNIPPISIENETECLNQIKNQCTVQLEKYPTTHKEDLKILETNKDLTYNQRNCVIMRSGEKQVSYYVDE